MPAPLATPAPVGAPEPNGLVVFVTDFGAQDTYAAQMVGALLNANPRARVAAGFHAVPPQNVPAGADALGELAAAFPVGTCFVTVVDPGVGTDRPVLAAACGGTLHVAPDNGLLAPLLDRDPAAEVVRLAVPGRASATFHGRDVMAPAAGRLTRGEPLHALGEPISAWRPLDRPGAEKNGDAAVGRVARADRFGNLITDIPAAAVPDAATLTIGDRTVRCARTYADVDPGEPVALVGSNGCWELAVRNGSAAALHNLGPGAPAELRP